MQTRAQINQYQRDVYYPKNHDTIRQSAKRRYHLNLERNRLYRKRTRLNHPELGFESQKKWQDTHRQQYRAKQISYRLIPLAKECEICGSTEQIERHHRDYGKPLEVLMLCKICHEAYHDMEQPICSKQPDMRFIRGLTPVEVVENPYLERNQGRWTVRILATGELLQICPTQLHILPKQSAEVKL